MLADEAADILQRHQSEPDAMIWLEIIVSEQAAIANENGSPWKALGCAKRARDILETVENIDAVTMEAAAPTTLGVLYHRVPGFPIGFGDDDKARHYLQEATKNAPNGFDANVFYGVFLYEHKEYAEAERILKHALMLPTLADRPIWDRSQRSVVRELLTKVHSVVHP